MASEWAWVCLLLPLVWGIKHLVYMAIFGSDYLTEAGRARLSAEREQEVDLDEARERLRERWRRP
jgi:hypothetical protein